MTRLKGLLRHTTPWGCLCVQKGMVSIAYYFESERTVMPFKNTCNVI